MTGLRCLTNGHGALWLGRWGYHEGEWYLELWEVGQVPTEANVSRIPARSAYHFRPARPESPHVGPVLSDRANA